MKKALFILLSAAALCFACGKPGTDSQPSTPTIEAAAQSQEAFSKGITFGSEGNFQSLAFTASDAWSIVVTDTKASSWLSIQPESGPAGKATVSVSAPANPTTAERAASVTVKCGSASKQFTVRQAGMPVVEVTAVNLDKSSMEVQVGKVKKLNVTVSPANATDPGVTWSSSNEAAATVDSEGNVKGIAPGSATITVKSKNGMQATCQVTVVSSSSDNTEGYEGGDGQWD